MGQHPNFPSPTHCSWTTLFFFFPFVASDKHESAERILLTSGYSQVGLNQYDTVWGYLERKDGDAYVYLFTYYWWDI